MKNLLIITILFLTTIIQLNSQNSLSARVITVSTHPFAESNLALHKNPIDNLGYVTLEPGLILSYDRYLFKKFSFRFSTAVMNDRFNLLAGYSQILLKYKILKYYKHSLYVGFGPAIHYSTNKIYIENYVNEDNYSIVNNTMYKFSWLSGLVEYNYYMTKEIDLALALNHIHPRSVALSIGVRFDIPDPNGKGCNCPSFR